MSGSHSPRHSPLAFTLVELLTSLGILSLLASFLFPVFSQATRRARRTTDQSALRQLASAWLMYCQDHDETAWPSPASQKVPRARGQAGSSDIAYDGLIPYLGGKPPDDPAAQALAPDPTWGTVHHAYNAAYIGGWTGTGTPHPCPESWHANPVSLAQIEVPWDTLVFCDSGRYLPPSGSIQCTVATWPPSGAPHHPPTIHARHDGRANVAFADGHACAVTVVVPRIHPSADRWRNANLGWLVRRGHFDDALYNGLGIP